MGAWDTVGYSVMLLSRGGTVWHFLSLPAQCYTEGQNPNAGQTLAIHVIITTKPALITSGNPFLVYVASPL